MKKQRKGGRSLKFPGETKRTGIDEYSDFFKGGGSPVQTGAREK